MHGVFQIIEKALGWQKYEGHNWVVKLVRIIITFLLVNFAWVFFRMPNINDAFGVMGRMFTVIGKPDLSHFGSSILVITFVAIGTLFFKDVKDEFFFTRLSFLNIKVIRWSIYVFLFCMILCYGVLDGGQFIYVSF